MRYLAFVVVAGVVALLLNQDTDGDTTRFFAIATFAMACCILYHLMQAVEVLNKMGEKK
jgi:hypothetical protein